LRIVHPKGVRLVVTLENSLLKVTVQQELEVQEEIA
jgi:hypothetical protein